MDFTGSPVMALLRRELDACALRQRVIANNVANVDTPGFKRSTVSFEEALKEAAARDSLPLLAADPRHFGGGGAVPEPAVVKDESKTMRADGNNVDVEREMTALALNTIRFNAAAQELSERLALLSYVITGRR